MISKIKAWIIGVFAFIGLALGIYFSGRNDGKNSAAVEQAKESAKAIKKAREIENEVEQMHPDDVRSHIDYRVR